MQDKPTYPTISSTTPDCLLLNKLTGPSEMPASPQNTTNPQTISAKQDWIGSSIGRWTKEEHYKFIEGINISSTQNSWQELEKDRIMRRNTQFHTDSQPRTKILQ